MSAFTTATHEATMPPTTDNLPQHIAAFIRARRRALGWTQTELGRRIGVRHTHVSYWETGTNMPGASAIVRLCTALGCSADELLGRA